MEDASVALQHQPPPGPICFPLPLKDPNQVLSQVAPSISLPTAPPNLSSTLPILYALAAATHVAILTDPTATALEGPPAAATTPVPPPNAGSITPATVAASSAPPLVHSSHPMDDVKGVAARERLRSFTLILVGGGSGGNEEGGVATLDHAVIEKEAEGGGSSGGAGHLLAGDEALDVSTVGTTSGNRWW
ncbi:hypothetical protein NE237_021762 [Protea cynaroides]|uniref:Uncharacterized protein n=1 Tax=Protea cynaroides TaxID=273540 RepID=A0A9Q0H8K2_9MAGN|nr:hypothetical protein NE237_021762 [Protea cynaroides]